MKKKIFISFFMAIAVVAVGSISRAAIEIKPGTTAYTSIDVSSAYQLCYDLRANDTTLGNNSLDPHLTLNKDWGAVAYLGASAYGDVRSLGGSKLTYEGKNYYSTTGNKSGVMNMGTSLTQTSCIVKNKVNDTTNIYARKNLIDNKDTKYVECLSNINKSDTLGMAIDETKYWYNAEYRLYDDARTYVRKFIWGFTNSGNTVFGEPSSNSGSVTFRPVIWN